MARFVATRTSSTGEGRVSSDARAVPGGVASGRFDDPPRDDVPCLAAAVMLTRRQAPRIVEHPSEEELDLAVDRAQVVSRPVAIDSETGIRSFAPQPPPELGRR